MDILFRLKQCRYCSVIIPVLILATKVAVVCTIVYLYRWYRILVQYEVDIGVFLWIWNFIISSIPLESLELFACYTLIRCTDTRVIFPMHRFCNPICFLLFIHPTVGRSPLALVCSFFPPNDISRTFGSDIQNV